MQHLHEYASNTLPDSGLTAFTAANAFSTNRAAARATLSRANRPTIWTPSGIPLPSASPGTLTQGGPSSVHSRLNVGLPVDAESVRGGARRPKA